MMRFRAESNRPLWLAHHYDKSFGTVRWHPKSTGRSGSIGGKLDRELDGDSTNNDLSLCKALSIDFHGA